MYFDVYLIATLRSALNIWFRARKQKLRPRSGSPSATIQGHTILARNVHFFVACGVLDFFLHYFRIVTKTNEEMDGLKIQGCTHKIMLMQRSLVYNCKSTNLAFHGNIASIL